MKIWYCIMDIFYIIILGYCCLVPAQLMAVDNDGTLIAADSRCLRIPPQSSRCRAAKPAFYFDLKTRSCKDFQYGGCAGDESSESREQLNLFTNERECRDVCSDLLCPDALCLMECGPQGYEVDQNGCRMCQCKTSHDPFPPLAACPLIACPDPLPDCPNGYELNEKGCETCVCKKASPPVSACQQMACATICKKGYVMDGNGCTTCQCVEEPSADLPPVPCPEIECESRCPRGFRLDLHGCQTCHCIEPSPLCPERTALCSMYCEHGFMLDKDGCQKCACAGKPLLAPCTAMACVEKCPRGYRMDSKGCQTCECIKESGTCPSQTALCAMHCEFGFKMDQSGCPTCACADKPEESSENCNQVACNMYCPGKGFRKNDKGCPICECEIDPCESARCLEDEICVSQSSTPGESLSGRPTQVYTVRCVKIYDDDDDDNNKSFSLMMTVVAIIIACSLTAVVTAIIIIACTRSQRRRTNAVYKPLDLTAHM